MDGRPLYLHVADLVARLGADARSASTATATSARSPARPRPTSLRRCARPCRSAFLLVPGYGAQGAGADALAGIAAGEAAGFVVNASRSIIYAWQDAGARLSRAAAAAAESMRSDLQDVL